MTNCDRKGVQEGERERESNTFETIVNQQRKHFHAISYVDKST